MRIQKKSVIPRNRENFKYTQNSNTGGGDKHKLRAMRKAGGKSLAMKLLGFPWMLAANAVSTLKNHTSKLLFPHN